MSAEPQGQGLKQGNLKEKR